MLGREVEIGYDILTKEGQTEIELLVLEPVLPIKVGGGVGGVCYERLGTVKLVFLRSLELPLVGVLRTERK